MPGAAEMRETVEKVLFFCDLTALKCFEGISEAKRRRALRSLQNVAEKSFQSSSTLTTNKYEGRP